MTEPRIYYADDRVTLIHGRWQDALAAGMVPRVGAVITDPPYSARTHEGHDTGARLAGRGAWPRSRGGSKVASDVARPRAAIGYEGYKAADVAELVTAMRGVCDGWIACLSDSELCHTYRLELEAAGLTGFQPVPCVISGMTVRLCGDGPSSWAVYLNVGRPPAYSKWGTLRGAYVGPQGDRVGVTGSKPLWLMRAIVEDYSREGDLVLDPCAGGGTTGVACKLENRRCILVEQDAATCEIAARRVSETVREHARQTVLGL